MRKDLFRLRWILLLWAIVLAAGLVLASIQAGLDGETYYPFWLVTNIVVGGFLPLFPFGLVMGLMHDDPVAEIDAFWITRPISGGELLWAKTGGLVAISLVPVLVTLPFWLAHDLGATQLQQAAKETLLGHFFVVVVALPFALISPNGSRFVLNVMLGAGGLLLVLLVLRLGGGRPVGSGDALLLQSKAWLIAWLCVAASVVVALNQFLRRRLRWSLAALALAAAIGLVVSTVWARPLAFLSAAAGAEAPPPPGATVPWPTGGAVRAATVLNQVLLRDGQSASRRGLTLKIQTVFVDFTGELQVSFSEARPRPARGVAGRLPGATTPPSEAGRYVLFNPLDGVVLPIAPQPVGTDLEAGNMRFKHAAFRLRPGNSWQGKPPANFPAWLQGAWLVKVSVPEVAPAGGSL